MVELHVDFQVILYVLQIVGALVLALPYGWMMHRERRFPTHPLRIPASDLMWPPLALWIVFSILLLVLFGMIPWGAIIVVSMLVYSHVRWVRQTITGNPLSRRLTFYYRSIRYR